MQARLLLKLTALVLAGSFLVACQTLGGSGETSFLVTKAERYEARGDYRNAARLYEQVAARSPSTARADYQLLAARSWFLANDAERAFHLVSVSGKAIPNDSPEFVLLAAGNDLANEAPGQALNRLSRLPELSGSLAARALDLKSAAHFMRGEVVAGIRAGQERETWLTARRQLDRNALLIWERIRTTAESGGLVPAPEDTMDPALAGWLELGQIAAQNTPFDRAPRLAFWRENYPEHPAAGRLFPQLFPDTSTRPIDAPRQVAVMLPLSGRVSPAGRAIRDGFFAGYFDAPGASPRPLVRVYDSASANIVELYKSAVEGGADFVVGPLLKNQIGELARQYEGEVPVLALNYLPASERVPNGLYQFALAPEDDAVAVAERLFADGITQGVALIPEGGWGSRVLSAFVNAMESRGGRVLSGEAYDSREKDFGQPIQRVLHLDESKRRHRALQSAIGEDLKFEPRRRQDVEFVFLAAQPQQARLLRPQLRYHYAADLPVYATSDAFEPDPRRNGDLLEGLMFVDIPWMISTDDKVIKLRETLGRHWPTRTLRQGRLYAMGYDAFQLVSLLYAGAPELEAALPGMTGELVLGPGGRIQRRALSWALVQGGQAEPLPEPGTEIVSGNIANNATGR